jgi:aspartyl protease family protein
MSAIIRVCWGSKPILALLVLLIWEPILAAQVRVLALFPGKAMVSIDGARRLLSAGDSSPEGVLLVSADPRQAVLEIDGERRTLGLSSVVGGPYAKPVALEARILRNNAGGYTTVGSVNGQAVSFLVDTGASSVVLNEHEARRLGLQFRLQGDKLGVTTASGATTGYGVILGSVRIGDIRLSNVRAIVLRGDYPRQALLGMSFLGQVKIEHQNGMMVLRSKR